MPHKHRRKGDDDSNFNLPPHVRANALPVGKQSGVFTFDDEKKNKKRKRAGKGGDDNDDTPRAFKRILQLSSNPSAARRSGLDDGARPKKSKAKKAMKEGSTSSKAQTEQTNTPSTSTPTIDSTSTPSSSSSSASTIPKILPGESLSDFSARVNASLPLAGLSRKTKSASTTGGVARQTRMEKKLQKGYAAWRAEEARLKEKEQERLELAEEEEEERDAMWGTGSNNNNTSGQGTMTMMTGDEMDPDADATTTGSTRATVKLSKRKRRYIGEITDPKTKTAGGNNNDDDDPWAILREKRERPKGLNDFALAPPTFTKLPVEKFKTVTVVGRHRVRTGGSGDAGEGIDTGPSAIAMVHNVPSQGKSLKQREELGQTRKEIIERYRALMRANR